MIRTLLAIGTESLEKNLIKVLKGQKDIEVIERSVFYKEALSDTITITSPDVVVVSDFLDGSSLSKEELIQLIRSKHPDTRVVYLTKDNQNVGFKRFLFQLGIYDVMPILPKMNVSSFVELILRPNQWKDISNFFDAYNPNQKFAVDENYLLSNTSNKDDRLEFFNTPTKKNEVQTNFLDNIVAFWSTRNQSGTTTLAINSAVMLAQNESEKILLVDLNLNNPNLHLNLSVEDQDGNHNLSALCEDVMNGDVINAQKIDDYILYHPFYKNIKVLPGFLLDYEKPPEEVFVNVIDFLFEYVNDERFTSVIFDLDSGLNDEYNLTLLRKVNKVIMPILERPGTVIDLQKFFNTVLGPFYLNKLDINKIYPVLNKCTKTNDTEKISHIIQSVLSREIISTIPYIPDLPISTNSGLPYLKTKPEHNILREFIKTANLVNNVFIVPPKANIKKNSFNFFGHAKK